MDFELLKDYREGLLVLSGCMASELQRKLNNEGVEQAKEVARKYHQVFGDDYYLEIQSHRDQLQQKLNRQIVDIAKELGIKWVNTADSHY
ncbi:PHP domain-containing protein, partial [Mycobacterium tuberculosis]|uniref:PHP domain-containing protein n=1 Tax=Mycobacterium tuberculosis TaxID=1773 RepID=UPI001F3A6E0B